MLEHFPHRWHVYRNLKWSALCETKQWPIKHSSHPCRMSFSFGHVLSIKSSHMRLNGTFSSENIDCFSQRTRCFRRNRFYYADMHKQIVQNQTLCLIILSISISGGFLAHLQLTAAFFDQAESIFHLMCLCLHMCNWQPSEIRNHIETFCACAERSKCISRAASTVAICLK